MANGLSPDTFWLQTPRMLHAVFDGTAMARDEAISLAWLNARLSRAKKVPELAAVLGQDTNQLQATEPDELLAMFTAMRDNGAPMLIKWEPGDDG